MGTGKMIDDLGMKELPGGAVVRQACELHRDDAQTPKLRTPWRWQKKYRQRVKRERGIDLEYEVELWSSSSSVSFEHRMTPRPLMKL